MGYRVKSTPVGKGTITIQTVAGDSLWVTNVLHVPGIGMNLISVLNYNIKDMMYTSSVTEYMSSILSGKRGPRLELEAIGYRLYKL